MSPADSATATALRVQPPSVSANDQPKRIGLDNRDAQAQAMPAVPLQHSPVADVLAAVAATSSGSDAARAAVQEQGFEQLLGSRAVSASRAEPMQQPVPIANLSATSTIAATDTVATPVGQHGFAHDFSHRVMVLVNGQVKSAELALTPPELGPVRVSIELRGQDASISFIAAAPAARAALEEALPRLREMFTQQGLNLLDANVGAQVGQHGHRTYGRPPSARGNGRDDGAAVPSVSEAGGLPAASGRPTRLIDVIA
jgi:flagellar hook-length control protein FliK